MKKKRKRVHTIAKLTRKSGRTRVVVADPKINSNIQTKKQNENNR
jgi:hypothetical protein